MTQDHTFSDVDRTHAVGDKVLASFARLSASSWFITHLDACSKELIATELFLIGDLSVVFTNIGGSGST
ncbi:MAG: hypothetical protein N838_12200 [Thiohalocapsa sp. PB-PSB1]|nr:MAG: hypothetical protein N838_12200 [Thiohalocapsa sp. PB-PSB1]